METSDGSLDLVVVADLALGRDRASRIQEVDKDSLDEFLDRTAPAVEMAPGTPISFASFKDFRPERLAVRLPAVAQLRNARAQALEAAAGRGSAASLKETLGGLGEWRSLAGLLDRPPPPVAPPPTTPAPSGGIFDLVDVQEADGPTPAPSTGAAQRLIDLVVGHAPMAGAPSPADFRAIADRLEGAVAPLLRSVVRDPAIRNLEQAWRGLRWLVRSVDFRAGTRLHVVPSDGRNLRDAVRRIVLPFAIERRTAGRRICLLLDFAFDPFSPEQVAELQEITTAAAEQSVPLLASAEAADLESLASRLNDRSNEAWHRLRDRESSRWLALAANRFLLRLPYGRGMDAVRDFAFEENPAGEPPQFLWGRPGWWVAALVASSVARTGWGVDLAGREAAESLEALPVREMTRRHGEPIQIPLEGDLGEPAARDLLEAGVLALVCRPNSDRPFAAGTPSVHRDAPQEPTTSWRQSLFAAHVAVSLQRLLDQLDLSKSLDEIARTLAAGMEILGLTEHGAAYTVRGEPSRDPAPAVILRVRPEGAPLRGLHELRLDVPIPLH
jgi:hypothetical protein